MLRIRCYACRRVFTWDESEELEPGGGLAKPGEQGAAQIIVWCPRCHQGNKIWVKGIRTESVVAEEDEE